MIFGVGHSIGHSREELPYGISPTHNAMGHIPIFPVGGFISHGGQACVIGIIDHNPTLKGWA